MRFPRQLELARRSSRGSIEFEFEQTPRSHRQIIVLEEKIWQNSIFALQMV